MRWAWDIAESEAKNWSVMDLDGEICWILIKIYCVDGTTAHTHTDQ